jgi:hypothetical protein
MIKRGWRGTGIAVALLVGLAAGSQLGTLPVGAAPVAGLDETADAVQLAQAGRSGMDITVRGIDDAIKQLNAVQGNVQSQQAAIVLLLVQGAGKKQAPENGRTRYDYHVDVQPDGRILINGLDVSMLIQAANQKR